MTISFDGNLTARVTALGVALKARGSKLATAESCTGGLIAAACTSIAGSSDWFERGFVTYSNDAKIESLGVPRALIDEHGAVSREVALAMAEGTLSSSRAQVAVAVTGIAGPGGGSREKPVGTVWLSIACEGKPPHAELLQLKGTRDEIRAQTVDRAIEAVQRAIDKLETIKP